MKVNPYLARRTVHLLRAQANSFAESERTMLALATVLEELFEIDEKPSEKASKIDDSLSPGFMTPHNPEAALKVNTEALAGISGTTLSVTQEPTLVKRWSDGKELWSEPVGNSGLVVFADNSYMLSHPSDQTEELLERLQEDHGV